MTNQFSSRAHGIPPDFPLISPKKRYFLQKVLRGNPEGILKSPLLFRVFQQFREPKHRNPEFCVRNLNSTPIG